MGGARTGSAASSLLNRLRTELDTVAVLDAELDRRFLAGAGRRATDTVPREEAAFRRLFTALKKGRRAVNDVLDETSDLHEGRSTTVFENTHALAVVAAAPGHRRAVLAFPRHHLAFERTPDEPPHRPAPVLADLTDAENITGEAHLAEHTAQADTNSARASRQWGRTAPLAPQHRLTRRSQNDCPGRQRPVTRHRANEAAAGRKLAGLPPARGPLPRRTSTERGGGAPGCARRPPAADNRSCPRPGLLISGWRADQADQPRTGVTEPDGAGHRARSALVVPPQPAAGDPGARDPDGAATTRPSPLTFTL